jgi:tRNA-specific 2-thiouridylase
VKWQTLLERARLLGCDYLATGHYARTEQRGDRIALMKAKYLEKDQSYALWGLSQESLARTLFPVGNLEKPEVRRIARELNLVPADHPESQDICFVPDDDYRRFLNDNFGSELKLMDQGEIVGPEGNVLGYHQGITNYTIGQRRGLGIAADRPLYVTLIDPKQNRVYVDYDEHCVSSEAFVREMNWVTIAETDQAFSCTVKVRYRDEGHAAVVFPMENGNARIQFDEPVRAITPGQSAVFYHHSDVLAGGLLYDPQLEGQR